MTCDREAKRYFPNFYAFSERQAKYRLTMFLSSAVHWRFHSRRTLMTAERTASLNCGKMLTVVMLLARRPAEPSPGGDKSHPDDEHLAAVPLSSISRTFK